MCFTSLYNSFQQKGGIRRLHAWLMRRCRGCRGADLHVSPRGEVKCVRGPPGRGASRAEEKGARRRTCQIASFTPRVTKHGLSGSPAVRRFSWSEPGPRPWFSRITRHEPRITAFFCMLRLSCGEKCRLSLEKCFPTCRRRLTNCMWAGNGCPDQQDRGSAWHFFPGPRSAIKEMSDAPGWLPGTARHGLRTPRS